MERLAGDYTVAEDKPAGAAGVTLQTASAHLAKLEAGGLLAQRKQGRHRYFALADDQAGRLLESIMGFAAICAPVPALGIRHCARHASATTISPATTACACSTGWWPTAMSHLMATTPR
jgi:hypothetical protein